jgi:PAS domain S-box-containing protein
MSKTTVVKTENNIQSESAGQPKPKSDRSLSKALYQILFNAVNYAIVLVDSHTNLFIEVNDKFCEMTGFSRAEVKGLSVSVLFTGEPPFGALQAQEYIQKVLTEGPQLFEWLAQDRHGRRHWVELNLAAAPIGRKRYIIGTVRDIQARKEAEQKASRSEAAISALLDALEDTALLVEPDGIIVAANQMTAQRLRCPLHKLIGLNIYELLPPEVAQIRRAMGEEVIKSGKAVHFYDRREDTYFSNTVYPIFDAAGRVSQIGIYAMDITAEKKTREELEKIKARLECLLDHSPSALYSCHHSESCELIYFSKNIVNLTGFTKEEILSDPFLWFQHIHPDDRRDYAAIHLAGVKADHHSREFRFLHRDGSYRWLHDEFNLVKDKRGTPLEYVGSLIDITAAREVQEALALSERRYRAIVECQTDLIDRFLPDTTLIYANDAICRLMDKNRQELIGQSFLPFLATESRQQVQAALTSLTVENPVSEIEVEIILSDGTRCWLTWMNYAFFNEQGQVVEFQGVGRDITRRKLAEEALRESETRFRLYTEGSLVGVYVLQDDRLVYANPMVAQIFAYDTQEMIGMQALNLVHPDDREVVRRKMSERFAGKPSEQYAFRGVRKDGTTVHCELLGRLVEYQGRPAILGSLLDVSQRWEAQEALRESEKQYRQLIETMNDGLGAMDEHRRVTYVNPKMSELFGYTEGEFIGRSITDLLDKANQKILQKNLEERRLGDQTSYEISWRRADGSEFPSIVSPKPVFDGQGNFKGSFAIITDITARREAEAAVQRREQYFRQLTENVSDVIGLLAADGTISYVNPIIKETLGYESQELLGNNAVEFVHPDEVPRLRQIYSMMKRRPEEIYQAEIRMRHRNNSWHVWQVKGKNLLNDPVVRGIVINAQDITEQKNLEAALQCSAKKLRLLTAQIFTAQETERRRLSLELHDELGQSLTALKLQLRSIANKLRKDQGRLKQECMQMLSYINEVVEDVRRLSHDLSPSLLENVGLEAALHHLLDNFRKFYRIVENLAEISGIETALPAEGKIHLYRIFQEILTNIEKHSRATEVRVQINRTDYRLSCVIADNGRGMPVEFAERSGGTVGLGLPAINERVLMLGGTLEIFSHENAGTEIRFNVPLANTIL